MIAEKVVKIQNKSKSLMWGCTRHSETETLFVVGHKSYPKQIRCFAVTSDLAVDIVTDEHKLELFKSCKSESEVLEVICSLLKQWFPAKGVESK